ncbi:hypothetical protein R1flu_002537 [Riccia fluitans]|uniref:Uncharacterized protein n=1 Tax=Riccia fluitans TaxID=41844 RepID=A0ABD1Y6E1_9MARC
MECGHRQSRPWGRALCYWGTGATLMEHGQARRSKGQGSAFIRHGCHIVGLWIGCKRGIVEQETRDGPDEVRGKMQALLKRGVDEVGGDAAQATCKWGKGKAGWGLAWHGRIYRAWMGQG